MQYTVVTLLWLRVIFSPKRLVGLDLLRFIEFWELWLLETDQRRLGCRLDGESSSTSSGKKNNDNSIICPLKNIILDYVALQFSLLKAFYSLARQLICSKLESLCSYDRAQVGGNYWLWSLNHLHNITAVRYRSLRKRMCDCKRIKYKPIWSNSRGRNF